MGVAEFRAATSTLMSRLRFFNQAGITFNGARDLYQILGYRRQLDYKDYLDRYRRDGIAARIVEAFPRATWRGGVEIYEDDDPQKVTAFEQAFLDLEKRLHVWQTLETVDILAGISTYAVLLIGAPGELTTELPKGGELLFLKPYSGGGQLTHASSRASAMVASFDTDPMSPRFGEPQTYWFKQTSVNQPVFNREVHWSRVIHVAEKCLEDSVYGTPTLESVFNLLDDLAKITGGGSEAHWLRANAGLHLDVDKEMGLPGSTAAGLSPEERKDLRDKAEELQHQLQRVIVTRGVTATQLSSDVGQFGANADAVLKQIAGAKGIPMRILTGSEMGTLASEQDAANFDSQVQDRRTGYAGPMIVRRLIDRLIDYRYLPEPKQYEVGWPVEENMDEGGKADYAVKLATINKTYGIVVVTDDEIRDMAFNKAPLEANKKVPVAQPVRETGIVSNTDNPDDLVKTLKALEAAIEADDLDAVGALLEFSK